MSGDLQALATGDVQPFAAGSLSAFSATANTDMLTSAIEVDDAGTLRVLVKLSVATTFSLKVTDGSNSDTGTLNLGANLTANSWWGTDIPVQAGDSYNFQVGADCTVWLRANKQMLA